MHPSVFISYSSDDREVVLAIDQKLRTHGINTWVDRHQISGGATWTAELVKGIRDSRAVLLMASRSAFASANVQREIALAGDDGKTIIPVILERSLTIPAAFEYWLIEKHRLEAFESDEVWFPWVFRSIVPTDSGPSCPAIPVHRAHPFRSIVPTLRV